MGSPAETSLRHGKLSPCVLCSLMKKERVSLLGEVREGYLGRMPGDLRGGVPTLTMSYEAFCQLKTSLAFSFTTVSGGIISKFASSPTRVLFLTHT